MKKLLIAICFVGWFGALASADTIYTTPMANGVQAASTTFVLNLATAAPSHQAINRLSIQANYANQATSTNTFGDGQTSTGSFTVTTVSGLVSAPAADNLTVTASSNIVAQPATDNLTVVSTNGLTSQFITINGNKLTNGVDWFSTSYASSTATNIAAAISKINGLQANAAGAVVYATATIAGVQGNAFTLTSSTPTAMSAATANFTGGTNPALRNAVLTINGIAYPNGVLWTDASGTSNGTATSIANLVNHIAGLQANAAGSVVYATATVSGTAGNAFTWVSSTPTALTVATPTFTGGTDNASVSIGGLALTQGTAWTKQSTASGTAKSISDAIVANGTLNQVITSTWTNGGAVNLTALKVGTGQNYTLLSSTPAAITASGTAMTGGINAAYTINTTNIAIPSHGLAQAQAVLYTSGTITIAPLVNQTTYYAGVIDANTIALASSTVQAVAGHYLTLTSSSTAGPHTFTLAPLATTGTASFKWQASNDCITYNDLNVSSVTIPSPYTTGSQGWDFGFVNWVCLQLNYIAPTTGGINLQIIPNGKN